MFADMARGLHPHASIFCKASVGLHAWAATLVFHIMHRLARLLQLLGLLFFAGWLAGCVEEPPRRLRVGTVQWPGYEPFFLARSLGYYDERRIQLIEFPSTAEMLLAYRNKAIDAATLTADECLRLAGDGLDPRIVLVLDTSHGGDAVLARPTIPDVAGLRGKKVAVESNALGSYVLGRALESAGLGFEDVQIVSVRVDRLERELTVNNVEAVVAYEPYRSKLLAQNVRPIFDSSQMPGEILATLVVPRALAEQPPVALRELATGWFRALDHLAAQPDDAAERMARREGVTPAQFRASLGLLKLIGREENQRLLSPDAAMLPERLRRIASFMAKTGMLAQEVDPGPLRSDRLVREVKP